MTRRLYLRVWAGFVGMLLLMLVASWGVLAVQLQSEALPEQVRGGISVVLERLPPAEQTEDFTRELRRISRRVDVDISVHGPDGQLLGRAGRPLPTGADGTFHDEGRIGFRATLEDGRVVAVASRHERGWRGRGPWFLVMMGLALGAGAYPVSRGITRRLETTREAVAAWGRGDLGARAPVEGRDEVAEVAQAFNDAVDRVQAQLEGQRRTLASVSHELRSPLARLRMALELLDDDTAPERRALLADAVRDVEELDATVGDLLDVGRLQAQGVTHTEAVDLRVLLGEEGAHVGAVVAGPGTVVQGDPRLLRRMVRNLLENARAHGSADVEAWTTDEGLVVADRGPGVPAGEREAIFQPFHRARAHDEGAQGGVGLGLWLVREIATRHGGTVRCQPREGGGTCFVVTLPG